MAQIRFANNVSTQLLLKVEPTDDKLYVKNLEQGLKWPDISATGDFFMIVVDDLTLPTWEIMRCNKVDITSTQTVLTVDRALEGTTASYFTPGAAVENRLTAGTLDSFGEAYPIQVPVSRGGTGASNPADARTNLEVPSISEFNAEIARLEGIVNNPVLPSASTSKAGIVQLNSETDLDDETMAATPKAVKAAFDKATDAKANSATADKLTNARNIIIAGDGSGTAAFDGSSDTTITLDIPDASTSVRGIVQLTSATGSDSESLAATAKAVKTLYDSFTNAIDNLPIYEGATTLKAGVPGYVPSAQAIEKDYVLHGDGTWRDVAAPSGPVLEAERLANARDINLTGDATGTTSFDGSADVDIDVTIASASTTKKGLVKLSSAVDSDDETVAATSKAVKLVADKIASLLPGGASETAKKLETPRAINLAGAVTGTTNFDGSQDVTITTTAKAASTSEAGVVQLSDATNENSSTTAATSKAVSQLNTKINGIISGGTTINAATAEKLTTARNISLVGDVTGSAAFDGSTDISITTRVVNGGSGGGSGGDGHTFDDEVPDSTATNANSIVKPGRYYGKFTGISAAGEARGVLEVFRAASDTTSVFQKFYSAKPTKTGSFSYRCKTFSGAWAPWVTCTPQALYRQAIKTIESVQVDIIPGPPVYVAIDPTKGNTAEYTIAFAGATAKTKGTLSADDGPQCLMYISPDDAARVTIDVTSITGTLYIYQ